MKIEIPGRPLPLARHRHGKGKSFDTQKPQKRSLAWTAKLALPKGYAPPPAIALALTYCFCPPKSWSAKRRKESLGQPKTTTPDLSNLVKFTEDALNGILWPDDRFICSLRASKVFSEWEGTIIEVKAA